MRVCLVSLVVEDHITAERDAVAAPALDFVLADEDILRGAGDLDAAVRPAGSHRFPRPGTRSVTTVAGIQSSTSGASCRPIQLRSMCICVPRV